MILQTSKSRSKGGANLAPDHDCTKSSGLRVNIHDGSILHVERC